MWMKKVRPFFWGYFSSKQLSVGLCYFLFLIPILLAYKTSTTSVCLCFKKLLQNGKVYSSTTTKTKDKGKNNIGGKA